MTAVEWLRKELKTIPDYSVFYTRNYQWIDSIMNEAKEMEKQHLYNFYVQGGIDCITQRDRTVEDFYNETFKNTNK